MPSSTGMYKSNCALKSFATIHLCYMRISIWPTRRAGSWGYLAGSYERNSTVNMRENKAKVSIDVFLINMNHNNLEIINEKKKREEAV